MKLKFDIELDFSGPRITEKTVQFNILNALVSQANTSGISADEDLDYTTSIRVKSWETGHAIHEVWCGRG